MPRSLSSWQEEDYWVRPDLLEVLQEKLFVSDCCVLAPLLRFNPPPVFASPDLSLLAVHVRTEQRAHANEGMKRRHRAELHFNF